MEISRSVPITDWKIKVNFGAVAFWTVFALNYFYINRVLIVATYDRFRLGIFVLALSLSVIVVYQKIVKNILLVVIIALFSFITFLSAWINNISLLQFLAFVRIPILVYLIYNLVWTYLDTNARVKKILRLIFIIAAIQLPIIAIQRFLYPYLPERIKIGSISGQLVLTDFGMGTFSGDTSMAFALIGLVILLLFDPRIKGIVNKRWLLAGWLSLTVLFSNSQLQHFTIALIWLIFFLSQMKVKNILFGTISLILVSGTIILLSQSELMTFPLLQNSLNKLSSFTQIFEGNMDYEKFLSGRHARDEALSYYLNQPVKWIGDGPGTVYDTATGRRTIGGWGQIFTYYAEVGLIGWIMSVLIFFLIAFPFHVTRNSFRIQVSWVQVLIFLTINTVTFVKYPMGNSAIMFTYCVLLISYFVLSRPTKFVKTIPA